MDSNKNEECCFNRTAVIGTERIGKAVSAAKYQNQFNNNNLIEQENLMPAVHERVSDVAPDDDSAPVVSQANGTRANELPVKEKVLGENGTTRALTAVFSQSATSVSAGNDAPLERLLPAQHGAVECLTTRTSSFNTTANGSTSTVPETNGFPLDVAANGAGSDRRDESGSTLEAEAIRQATLDDGSGLPDDGEFSDNNSLGNLSYASENGLIEEIILLPNNVYSDDDNASTSDDCIYAYRGGEPAGAVGQLLELQGDQPPDDETDFLEMDFDPEPSSEMENFNRHPDFLLDLDDQYANAIGPANGSHGQEPGASGPRSPTSAVPGPMLEESGAPTSANGLLPEENPTPECSGLAVPTSSVAVPCAKAIEEAATTNDTGEKRIQTTGGLLESAVDRSQAHKTGAIPKNVPLPTAREGTSNSKNLKLDLSALPDEADGAGSHRYTQYPSLYYEREVYHTRERSREVKEDGEDAHCLDCAEHEFLMHTKQDPTRQRFCNVCSSAKKGLKGWIPGTGARSSYAREDVHGFYVGSDQQPTQRTRSEREEEELLDLRAEQIVFETLHKINTLKETPPSGGMLRAEGKGKPAVPEELERSRPAGLLHDQVVPIDYQQSCPENSVTIYTINCGELTIIEALARIGIAPNLDVLRQYFNDQYEVDTAKMTIPQYLLHMSKRDCNYKKLIEAIKSCCDDEPLDVQYYPLDPFSEIPEIVQISSCEIAKRWNANTNLRQIIHFKHKHFHTLNVLGKIVNILRQPSRGRHTNHLISIPQYYKSGFITITRVAGS